MRRKYLLFIVPVIIFLVSACREKSYTVTIGDLFDEISDLTRLASMPEIHYRTVQYS
ncbi:MAG: hypothetical protein MUE32_10515 [Bacteroidales bacterium]|nr:hypothetical protein [Bacteroidales bacterium]